MYKILYIKEYLDQLGHYESFNYNNKNFDEILNTFLTKANGVHTILSFKCDTIVLYKNTKYNFKSNLDKTYFLNKTKNIYKLSDIPFDKYDIIWCRDDILSNIDELIKLYPTKLFIYENTEHCFSQYNFKYDLILEHNDLSFKDFHTLNTTISFPYVIDKDILRKNINYNKINDIYFDSRCFYFNDNIIENYNIAQEYFKKYNLNILSNIIRPEISYKKDIKSDCKEYLENIGSSKFFVLSVKRCGQSLVEAAALKSIVLGFVDCIHTKNICHEYCILKYCNNYDEIYEKFNTINNNYELEQEILNYQDNKLEKYYNSYQKNVLKKALKLKNNSE